MMSSGDRTSFDNHQNSSASFPAPAVSGLDHPVKSVKFADSNFRRLNDPMEVEERNEGFTDTARAIGILKEIDSKVPEVSSVLMPNLLSFLKHDNPVVVRQSITTGTRLFCSILIEMALQLRSSSNIEGWLEEMWSWMLRFKDSVRSMLEVLPIFPRLVELPLDKFQAALARILQGSAHTGPALTPVEVLVAIHDVESVKHGVPLKKIADACTACFEQRTVFTQQVLAKSLSHMVEQVPLPMLFMRTAIQSIGNFPTLVDFVMEILSKLVSRQLPPPQLENALNKHSNLRGPLAVYANQPNIRTSLSRQTLQVLCLDQPQQAPTRSFTPAAALHTPDTNSSAHGATSS